MFLCTNRLHNLLSENSFVVMVMYSLLHNIVCIMYGKYSIGSSLAAATDCRMNIKSNEFLIGSVVSTVYFFCMVYPIDDLILIRKKHF